MKKMEFEIDMTRGFDVVDSNTNKVIAHYATYEEALIKHRERSSWYVCYYMLTEQAEANLASAA